MTASSYDFTQTLTQQNSKCSSHNKSIQISANENIGNNYNYHYHTTIFQVQRPSNHATISPSNRPIHRQTRVPSREPIVRPSNQTILRPQTGPRPQPQNSKRVMNTAHSVVSEANTYVHQMGMTRNASSPKSDDYDPDSSVYVANLPSDYDKKRLYQLLQTSGQIVRYKFVTHDKPSQQGCGFVQFANIKDAHRAIKNLEGHVLVTGETIYLSIVSSSCTNDGLRKVVGDDIGFVRYEDNEQAFNTIDRLDKQMMVEGGNKLKMRFATRKTAANAYRLQRIPQSISNENNLHIRNQSSSTKINGNGIGFDRFVPAEDAKRAIQELNCKKLPQSDDEIVIMMDKMLSKTQKDSVAPHHKPFKCPHCIKAFKRSGNLKRHLRIHSNQKSFKCSYCNNVFTFKCNLIVHIRRHTGEKPYQCHHCNKRFRQKGNMKRHITKLHSL
eukprot:62473_1